MIKTALLFFGGLAFMCLGLWYGLSEQMFLRSSGTVMGKITSKPEMYLHSGRRSAHPRYRFHYAYTVEGRSYESYEPGADDTAEPLTVFYDRRNPSHSRLRPPEPSVGYIFAAMGFFITSISALSYHRSSAIQFKRYE